MKRQIITISLVAIFTIATILIVAQNRRDTDVPAEEVNRAIQTFSKLLTPETVKSFGFNSVEDFRNLRAGQQFRKHIIGLRRTTGGDQDHHEPNKEITVRLFHT